MRHPDASRAAVSALNDSSAMVRAAAAGAILWLPAEERAALLLPLLNDKDEFVRREAAYALGRTRSHTAIIRLGELLLTDKIDEVRGAAAVALGEIGHPEAVTSLVAVFNSRQSGLSAKKSKKKSNKEANPFVFRSAARSLGQIKSRVAVPVLLVVVQDAKAEGDVIREAVSALGLIGDPTALPALRNLTTAPDPYLAEAAHEAIRSITRAQARSGG